MPVPHSPFLSLIRSLPAGETPVINKPASLLNIFQPALMAGGNKAALPRGLIYPYCLYQK